ncbi:endonuclease/exonuclease/phosphatase family protein [Agromyces binzhouensis]|uniref:Endonuclease/exonuclease/phosphatase family protein n=2 Tax=Agromyces binzhouensis TaxID=1817495 RepID=A0A4Q2JCM5_9MICO|nr:endonuclease/exonuclease/phosphatase family protein [Agromyces binzhouensis]
MTDEPLIGPVEAPDLHVMSFNIRRRMPRNRPGSPDRWATRKPLVRRLLAAERPTVLGVQEALDEQVEVVADALGGSHRWVGTGRDPGGHGEACPVYYDDARLELTEWRQLALSATPGEHGSRSWGNLTRRVVVSAEFTDRATGGRLHVFNTHLDHLSRRSRLQSARMIAGLAHAAHLDEPEAAIVVTGDFNADERSAVHRRLTGDGVLRDAWDATGEQLTPEWGTFSNYGPRRRGGRRIDLILVGGAAEVTHAGINAARFEGRAASDHEPVQAVLRHRSNDEAAGGREEAG